MISCPARFAGISKRGQVLAALFRIPSYELWKILRVDHARSPVCSSSVIKYGILGK